MWSLFSYKFFFTLLSVCVGYLAMCIVFPPLNFPRNIPTIPFYVTFIPMFTNIDQEQLYNAYLREKLEKHGAVKIYFASRWNILVTRPEFLQSLFKRENVYAKSGNQKKIPYSVLAEYTGDNVISAHGKTWKLYRSVLTKGLQFPSLEHVHENTQALVRLLKRQSERSNQSIVVNDAIQRFCLENVCQGMLGLSLDALNGDTNAVHERLKYVKSQIFSPVFMAFPFLDKLPIESRTKARKEVREFRTYFCDLAEHAQTRQSEGTVGYELREAMNCGKISRLQFCDNVMITMIAGHENPQLLITSLLYVVAKHPGYQKQLRTELREAKESAQDNELNYQSLPLLHAIIYETLRLYPPLGQIINRCTTENALLGQHIVIPKGTYVGYNNFGTGRDPSAWGEDADKFMPERWGAASEQINSNFLSAKRSCRLTSFHGGKRECIGQKFALFEAKAALAEIVLNFEISLDEGWHERLTPAGPICPLMLKLKLKPA